MAKTAVERISAVIEENASRFTHVSDGIWDAAELGLREYKSARLLIDELEHHGFAVERGLGGIPTAFVGKWGSGKPMIGICGEFDALAGMSQEAGCNVRKPITEGAPGHGCMHNLLGTASMAAAIAARYYMEEQGLPGTICYFGCPGEEHGSGKMFMARAGAFDGLDAAMCWHPDDFNSPWTTGNNAMVSVDFTFRGKAAHAARVPHLGRSALDACELMNVGCNYLREHMPATARIHYGYKNAGSPAANIVQDYACITYIVRSPRVAEVKELLERVVKVANGAAMMTETEMSYAFTDGTCEYVPNMTVAEVLAEALRQVGPPAFDDADRALAAHMRESLSESLLRARETFMTGFSEEEGPDWFVANALSDRVAGIADPHPLIPSSTDVGAVSYVAPTAQVVCSCRVVGGPNHSWLVAAQGKTDYAHKGMLNAAKTMALGSVMMIERDMEEKGDFFRRAKEELLRKTGGKFDSPFPDDLMPDVEPDAVV